MGGGLTRRRVSAQEVQKMWLWEVGSVRIHRGDRNGRWIMGLRDQGDSGPAGGDDATVVESCTTAEIVAVK